MTWQELVVVLARAVPAGSITTYAEVSQWGYGKRNLNQPVRSLLHGAANSGFSALTNRVVGTDGRLAALPGGNMTQQTQLAAEGINFLANGQVNLGKHIPVTLPAPQSDA